MPVVPSSVPPLRLKALMVSARLLVFKEPAETVTVAVSAIWSACMSFAVPPLTVRLPAMAWSPVVFRSSSPALTVVVPV